jgi:Flp pilus assembly protein TadB
VARTATQTPIELRQPSLGEALGDIAEAGKELATDQLELIKVEVKDQVERVEQKVKDQVERLKHEAQVKVERVKDEAKRTGARAGLLAGAGVLGVVAWGLLVAAGVVALAGPLPASAALGLMAVPHLGIAAALYLKQRGLS